MMCAGACGDEPTFDPEAPRDCGAGRPECRSSEVCLDGYGCYPRGGWADSTCGPAVPIEIDIDLPGLGFQPGTNELELTGVVASVTTEGLRLAHDDGTTTTIGVVLGQHRLPLTVGEQVHVLGRRVSSFGFATGVTITEPDGTLVALIDDGRWGSAWEPGSAMMAGFTIETEILGCALQKTFCYEFAPLGMRFSHRDGMSALALPGDAAPLTLGAKKHTVINAFAEQPTNVQCTDIAPRRAWAILRDL